MSRMVIVEIDATNRSARNLLMCCLHWPMYRHMKFYMENRKTFYSMRLHNEWIIIDCLGFSLNPLNISAIIEKQLPINRLDLITFAREIKVNHRTVLSTCRFNIKTNETKSHVDMFHKFHKEIFHYYLKQFRGE